MIVSRCAGRIAVRKRFLSVSERGRKGFCVNEAAPERIVGDRRIAVDGNGPRAIRLFKERARSAGRRRGGNETAFQCVPRRRFHSLPFLGAACRGDWLSNAFVGFKRKHSVLQIQGRLAIFVERVHWDDSEFSILANKDSRGGSIKRARRMDDGMRPPSRVSSIPSIPVTSISITSISVIGWR